MGWTTFNFNGTRSEFVESEFNKEPSWGTVIAHAVKGSTIYCAVKMGEKHGARQGKVFAMIILTSKQRGYCNFGYKEMSESCGPCQTGCPKRIFALLSPLEELYDTTSSSFEWASEWRKKCAAVVEKPKAKKLIEGQVIKLDEPVKTSYGISCQFFKYLNKNTWHMLVNKDGKLIDTKSRIRFRSSRFNYSLVEEKVN